LCPVKFSRDPGSRAREDLALEDLPENALGRRRGSRLFSVEVFTVTGLVRYVVLFVIDLKKRRVHIAGITNQPNGAWMVHIARNLSDAVVPSAALAT
jgi:hypothetical protein